jgi:hypothetical protein
MVREVIEHPIADGDVSRLLARHAPPTICFHGVIRCSSVVLVSAWRAFSTLASRASANSRPEAISFGLYFGPPGGLKSMPSCLAIMSARM